MAAALIPVRHEGSCLNRLGAKPGHVISPVFRLARRTFHLQHRSSEICSLPVHSFPGTTTLAFLRQ